MPSLRTLSKMKPRFCRPPNTTLLLVLSFALICFNADADAAVKVSSLSKGLVGHWTLAQNSLQSATVFADKTPYSNNGTSANTPSFTTDQHGQSNKAMTFNGSSDYVSVANNSVLNTSNKTISAWIKSSSIGNEQIIVSSLSAAPYNGFYLEIFLSKLYFAINTNDMVAGNTTLSSNTWYFVTATYDGSVMKVYLNGVLDNSKNSSAGISDSGTDFEIGRYTLSHGLLLNGSIADVRIYNRALSATEVTQLYNAYQPKYQVSTLNKGLVGHWKLSQASKKGALYGDAQ